MNCVKKIIYFTILMFVLSFIVSATDTDTYIYEYSEQGITVIFEEETCFPSDIREIIADQIVYGTPSSQVYSLCWLVGHDLYNDAVGIIYHKRSEYDPRCQYEQYNVEKCTKCDYAYPRLVSSFYISCCPPETSIVSLDD